MLLPVAAHDRVAIESNMPKRLALLVLGILVACYAGAALWVNTAAPENRLRQAFCDLWLCSVEFSPGRISDLHRDVFGGQAAYAAAEFRRALKGSPASAYRWADLAEASAADREISKYAAAMAVAAASHSPAVLLRAGNLAFSAGDERRAMAVLRRVLEDPELIDYYPAVFVTYSRMHTPTAERLQSGVPANRRIAGSLLRFEMEGDGLTEVATVWEWIVDHKLEDANLACDYTRFLIAHNSARAASAIWSDLNRAFAPEYRRTNWVFNGGFELPLQHSPLDWEAVPSESAETGRTDTVSYRGKWAAYLQFSGDENIEFRGISQRVVLYPGTWRIAAFVKTRNITTDQGIGVRIFDAVQSRRLDVRTDTLTGTHGWTKLERSFVVDQATTLAQVEVFRQPSLKFDNKVAGKAWIDAVELSPVQR